MLQATRKWIAPALAVMALAAVVTPSANAAFTLTIIEDGVDLFGPITSNGLNTNASDLGTIAINVDAINAGLQAFQINSLSATTNSVGAFAGTPGSDDLARLFQGGSVQLKSTATAGNHTLEIVVTDDGYTFPVTNPKVMTNSASTTFGNAVASQRTFQGEYTDASVDVTSGLMKFIPSGNVLSPPLPDQVDPLNSSGPPFTLTNTSVITLGTGSTTVGFQGTTFVTAVPEPASLSMGLISLPALLALGRRMRRRVDH
jgi:hypothetical protein